MLAGKENLARVSPTPGFTKLINFFTVNKDWRLVDLPGYGFAEGARKDSAKFNRAVLNYLEHRTNLCSVFALIESALPPQEIDIEFIEWLTRKAVPFVLVFTKIDKVPPAIAEANIAAFMQRIGAWYEKPPAKFTCSSDTDQGRQELLGVIDEAMTAIAADQQSSAQAHSAQTDSPRPREIPKKRPDRNRPW
jgi:GTP-binding protein